MKHPQILEFNSLDEALTDYLNTRRLSTVAPDIHKRIIGDAFYAGAAIAITLLLRCTTEAEGGDHGRTHYVGYHSSCRRENRSTRKGGVYR